MKVVEQIRRIKSLPDRFVALQDAIDDREKHVVPRLIAERDGDAHNFDLQEEIANVQYEIALLSIERARTIKALIETGGHTYTSIASLTGSRPRTDRNGDVVVDDKGETVLVPALSRQRVHQIYNGSGAYTKPGKKKQTKAVHPRNQPKTST